MAAGRPAGAALVALLGMGGFGFGLSTTALLACITNAVPATKAPDVSGLYNTNSQVAAVVGVATLGTLYLALASEPGAAAMHAFVVVTMAFAAAATCAAVAAHIATHPARARQTGLAAQAA